MLLINESAEMKKVKVLRGGEETHRDYSIHESGRRMVSKLHSR